MFRKLTFPVASSSVRMFCSPVIASTSETIINPLPTNRSYLLDSPQVTVPSFEISRKIGNIFAQTFYLLAYEKNFNVESLVHGANIGIHSLAHMLVDEKWDQMENLVARETVENLKLARKGISEKLEAALRFQSDDFVLSFLHSSIISGKDVLKLSKNRNIGIYFTVVSYVRLSENVPVDATITQLNNKKYKDDVLICNTTFSRVLNPLGVWKITSCNFFFGM